MEGVEEIKEYPGDDDTVVDTDETVDDETGYSNTDEIWGNGVPGQNGAFHGGLTKGELQGKERDTKYKEHDGVGY